MLNYDATRTFHGDAPSQGLLDGAEQREQNERDYDRENCEYGAKFFTLQITPKKGKEFHTPWNFISQVRC